MVAATELGMPITSGPYQGMAALDAWTYEDLKRDIKENGVLVPLVVTQDGVIVDGHHRYKIAEELGIVDTLPVEVRTYDSESAIQAEAIGLNALRRQMSKDERNRQIVRMRELGMTQRQIGDRLGLAHNRISEIESSSTSVSEVEEVDPLETAKAKAATGKGNGRGAYKFTRRESEAVQAEVERLDAEGLKQYEIADRIGISFSAVSARLHKGDEPEPSPLHEQIADCAARGMTSVQTASEVGKGVEWVRKQARTHGIEFPADKTSYKKHFDADAAMSRAVDHLDDALYAFTHIPMNDLDQELVPEWSRSLDDVAKSIRTLIRQLNQPTKEQDQS